MEEENGRSLQSFSSHNLNKCAFYSNHKCPQLPVSNPQAIFFPLVAAHWQFNGEVIMHLKQKLHSE